MTKKNGIPDRWLDYFPMGGRVAGTRFIAFKVPLKEALCDRLSYQDRFTPQLLVEQLPQLGLVVDLTNTNRYYSCQEFEQRGIKYAKVNCPGHVIPPKDLVHRFYKVVDQYIKENPNPESLIGTHCTHGLNRTAYFLCSYMIERMGIAPPDALAAFQNARGYNVERKNYIEALMVLKPSSSPSMNGLKPLYPIRGKPHLVCKVEHKRYPTPNETMHVAKYHKCNANSIGQGPVLSQYGGSQKQHCSSHQRNRHTSRGKDWNNSYGRQTQEFSCYSGGFEQQQSFGNQMYNSTDKDREGIAKSYSTKPKGRVSNGFSDGSQVAIRSAHDISGDWKASGNKYREYGTKAGMLMGNDIIGTQGRNFGNNSEGNARGRMITETGRSMSMNRAHNINNKHGTYQSVPKMATLPKARRRNTARDSLAQTYPPRQSTSMSQS